MIESRFFKNQSAFTVGEIASLTGAKPRAGTALSHRITGVAPIDKAGPADLTFLESAKFAGALSSTKAGAVLINEQFEARAPGALNALLTPEPYRAFITVLNAMFPSAARPSSLFGTEGVASGAYVHPSARIENGVTVDPGAMIGPQVQIGAGSFIGPMAVIGPNVQIGRDCAIGANSSITHAVIGDRVTVHPGCHIGQDGFGFVPSAKGHLKVPQIGSVVVHNDVEIGAGTTIDRGGIRDTVIGEGTKIDNLVQIGHNCIIGRHCIIVAQSGISGSVTLEDFVMLGGAVGIAPHITIGKGAQLAARSGVIGDIPAKGRWGGYPARPRGQWLRELATLGRMAERRSPGQAQIESPPISGEGQPSEPQKATHKAE